MSIDYIVSSLPALRFGEKAPISWAKFESIVSEGRACHSVTAVLAPAAWTDLETQLRNAMAEARGGGEKYARPATGCSVYWKTKVLACFQEKDALKRDEMLDKVWWDAAGELTPAASPLSAGALAAYAIRLKIALKREKINAQAGNEAFDRLTAETKLSL